jgi:hypothetical protein
MSCTGPRAANTRRSTLPIGNRFGELRLSTLSWSRIGRFAVAISGLGFAVGTGTKPMFENSGYYIAAAALAFGLIVIGLTRWIEHRREESPMPHLVPTTPFMLVGVLIVLLAVGFSLNLWRSTPAANFDARVSKSKAILSSDEMAEFKAHLSKCWVPPPGAMRMEGGNFLIRILLDPDGRLRAKPELIRAPASLSGPVLVESAILGLQRCQPYDFLPAKKYEVWKVTDLVFSPQGLSEILTVSAHDEFRPK